MTDKPTAAEAIEMRNDLEDALVARIDQAIKRFDAYIDGFFPKPNDADYIAEQDRIDLFFEADRIKFDDNGAAARFERWASPWVWSTRTCQPFPGCNHFVKKLDGGLELWFRVEFAFRGFVGYTVYDPAAHSLIRFRDIPVDIAEDVYQRFGVTAEQVADNCWWVVNQYLPCGPEAQSPNFRMMDDLSLALLDDEAFEEFCTRSEALIKDMVDKYADALA